MEQTLIYVALILSGLCLGSFAGASVWRLRARQLEQDKTNGESIDNEEYKQLKKIAHKSIMKDRSRCLHCSYELKWYDLLPIASWVALGGKCRKCRKQIGYMEPLIELGVAAFFVISFVFWPYDLSNALEIARFTAWLLSGVGLAILFAYDMKWFLLPDKISYLVMAIGLINAILVVLSSQNIQGALFSVVCAVLILSGIYWVLHMISDGKWIGFGDVKLGLGLALMLADWKLAFITLFAANLIGCFIVLPAVMSGKLKRNSHVPFGPLLIVGYIIAGLFGQYFLNVYFPIMF